MMILEIYTKRSVLKGFTMINNATYSFRDYKMPSYIHFIVLRILLATGIISLTFDCGISQAQPDRSGTENNMSPNSEDRSGDRSNYVRPVQQQYFYPDAGGSQQFFRQGNDRLYFLPEKKSDPILQIDESVKEEIEEDPLQDSAE